MAVTKSKNSYKIKGSPINTDDDTLSQKRTFDFSDGKFAFKLTFGQIITLIGFVFTITWSGATYWFYQMQADKLRAEFTNLINKNKEELIKSNSERDLEINTLKNQLNVDIGKLMELRNKNPYLK